ncbi:MAG: hypothetical protein ACYDEF_13740 [Methanosarcina sp.]
MEIYVKVTQSGESLTDAITNSLELYFADKPDNNNDIEVSQDILGLQAKIKELQEHIKIKYN